MTSSFTFGVNTGIFRGIFAAMKIPYSFIQPKDWQKIAIKGQPRKPGRSGLKEAVASAASRQWPELELPTKIDWGKADAAWIAEATRRKHLVAERQ